FRFLQFSDISVYRVSLLPSAERNVVLRARRNILGPWPGIVVSRLVEGACPAGRSGFVYRGSISPSVYVRPVAHSGRSRGRSVSPITRLHHTAGMNRNGKNRRWSSVKYGWSSARISCGWFTCSRSINHLYG